MNSFLATRKILNIIELITLHFNHVLEFIHTHYNIDLYVHVAMSMRTTLTSNPYHSKHVCLINKPSHLIITYYVSMYKKS